MAFRKSSVIPAVNRRRRRSTSISSQASFSALSRVNWAARLHQADIAFLNQIEELQATVNLFLRD
jgi:hypothetical protein